ncbi:hypothetical protein, partial [Enterocloster alcoholdehydrogenati]|uniref:hypothetical protein n=1 Tax=Enterocloster alcoholdehydrogenati TaxID=2547410 RepID=UPI0036F402A2
FVGNLWMERKSAVEPTVFHRMWVKITAGFTQWGKLQNIRRFCPCMGITVEISHTYPQVINKLWIM